MTEAELVKATAEGTIEGLFAPFNDLVQKTFGTLAEAIGGHVTLEFKARVLPRRLKLLQGMQNAIAEAGFEPSQIADNIWFPAVQAASLVDDETLLDMWSRLLANASDPSRRDSVHPSYVEILRQLSPADAVMLREIVTYTTALRSSFSEFELWRAFVELGLARTKDIRTNPSPRSITFATTLGYDLTRDHEDFTLMLENLVRAGLIREDIEVDGSRLLETPDTRLKLKSGETYRATTLGMSLIRACGA